VRDFVVSDRARLPATAARFDVEGVGLEDDGAARSRQGYAQDLAVEI